MDPRSLVISQSIFPSHSSIPSSDNPLISHINEMASNSNPSNVNDVSSNFGMSAYNSVTKLETGTFNDWKLRLTTVLGAHRLSKFILRDVTVPVDEKELEDYETNSMRTLAAIHATIDGENFEVIRNCSGPREAYLKLCKHHNDAGGLSTANLFSDLVTLRMASDGDLKDHVHKFRKIHNDLLSNLSSTPDIKISEPFVAIILINSLPSDFTPLVQSLLTNFETLTLPRLYSLLNIEATRSSGGARADTALSVSRFNGGRKPKKNESQHQQQTNKDTIFCSLGHAGHTDDQCRTKKWREFKEYQKSMKGKSTSEASKEKTEEVAQMTSVEAIQSEESEEVDVSYYDTAFSALESRLPEVFDTGATSHMFGDKKAFDSISNSKPSQIAVASKGGEIWAKARGSVTIGNLTLRDVLYSNKLTANLISIGKLCDDGYTAVFHKKHGYLLDPHRRVVLRMTRDPNSDRLWHPNLKSFHSALSTTTTRTDQASLWHRRLGHAHPDSVIQHLRDNHKIILSRKDFSPCDSCAMGKLSQSPSTSSFVRSSHVLDVIHSDLLGPISPSTKSGARYIMTFIDDHTRYNICYLLNNKDEAYGKFKQYKSMIENQTGRNIVKLKTDRGGEYSSQEFLNYLQSAGIQTERGPAHRPMANGVAERFNQTLLGRIRSQLHESGLPLSLWGELAIYCSHQINCTPSKAINNLAPINLFRSVIPTHMHPFSFNRLKPFGCLAIAHDIHRTSKISPVGKRYIFVGIESNSRAWRLWDKQSQRIFITGDAVFRENIFPAAQRLQSPTITSAFTYPPLHDAISSPTSHTDSIISTQHNESQDISPSITESQIIEPSNPDTSITDITPTDIPPPSPPAATAETHTHHITPSLPTRR